MLETVQRIPRYKLLLTGMYKIVCTYMCVCVCVCVCVDEFHCGLALCVRHERASESKSEREREKVRRGSAQETHNRCIMAIH